MVWGVKIKGSFVCSDHGIVEFRILRGESNTKTRITTSDFGRADCGLIRDLLERIPQYMALERREVHERQMIVKDHIFQAQVHPDEQEMKQSLLTPTCVGKQRATKLKHKKKVYKGWEYGQVTWTEYRDTI
ncbi:glycerol kinase [Pitangus sulphuratus]|nr:glycerol kinase [Pitangus sulphuratus]